MLEYSYMKRIPMKFVAIGLGIAFILTSILYNALQVQKFYELRTSISDSYGSIVSPLVATALPTTAVTATPLITPTANLASLELQCSDCSLAPVGKTYYLKSTYAPTVEGTTLPSGGDVTATTKAAFLKLVTAAQKAGIVVAVGSGYRSYQQQNSSFQRWVNIEMAKGLKQAEAEKKASNYSARPGHSEHQLGTTLDVRCDDCEPFDYSQKNLDLYSFLEKNAHKYGFVISYPKNSQWATGYVSEPWHIRYIGVELATEIYNQGYLSSNGKLYPEKFLKDKGRW